MDMKLIKILLFSAFSFFLSAVQVCSAERDFSKVKIESHKVSGGVYMLVGMGGNIGVSVGEDGIFLIDDQFAPLTKKILASLSEIQKGSVRFVLNTHYHGDHTGGNENLGKEGALIIAHENVRKRMSVENFNRIRNKVRPASPSGAWPVVTFTDAISFYLNGEEINASHVLSAHTDGDTIVHFKKSDVLHMGDTFFNGKYPFIDTDSGGSVDGIIAAAKKALEMVGDKTKIIPGHGNLAMKQDLVRYLEMLEDVRAKVIKLIQNGKNLKKAIKAKPSAKYDKEWGSGFIDPKTFITILYNNLK